MKNISALFIILGLLSCSRTTEKSHNQIDSIPKVEADTATAANYDSLLHLETYLVKNVVDTSQFQTINFDCAVLVYPTDEQIDEMKKEYGEEDFYTIADDANWYQGQAIGMLDSAGVTETSATKRFIKLVGEANTWTLDLRKKNMPRNMIFFKQNKQPTVVQTIDLTTKKVREYFDIPK